MQSAGTNRSAKADVRCPSRYLVSWHHTGRAGDRLLSVQRLQHRFRGVDVCLAKRRTAPTDQHGFQHTISKFRQQLVCMPRQIQKLEATISTPHSMIVSGFSLSISLAVWRKTTRNGQNIATYSKAISSSSTKTCRSMWPHGLLSRYTQTPTTSRMSWEGKVCMPYELHSSHHLSLFVFYSICFKIFVENVSMFLNFFWRTFWVKTIGWDKLALLGIVTTFFLVHQQCCCIRR